MQTGWSMAQVIPHGEQIHVSCYLWKAVNRKAALQVKFTAIEDWKEPFIKGTYNLEGNGPLAVQCCEIVATVKASVHAANMPNVLTVAEKLFAGVPQSKQLMINHARECIQSGIDYFNRRLSRVLLLAAFQAAHLFSYQKVHNLKPDAACIESLKTLISILS